MRYDCSRRLVWFFSAEPGCERPGCAPRADADGDGEAEGDEDEEPKDKKKKEKKKKLTLRV